MKIEEKQRKLNKNNKGISLIVLVITIIVIIILAAAVILALTNNNPISEANKARFQSDRDNMQSIFTSTVAKVMAQKQTSIKIEAGNLNSVKSGVSSTTGLANYTLEGVEDSSKAKGTIIFDNKDNTQTEYYTGKQLPIYKAGETIWSVDEEGKISLNIGDIIINDGNNEESGNSGSGTQESGGISKENYDNLVKEISEMKETIQKQNDKIEIQNTTIENLNTTINEIKNTQNSNNIIVSGKVEIGILGANESKTVKVTFSKPMKNTNYSIAISGNVDNGRWGHLLYKTSEKTINGFNLSAYNNDASLSAGNLVIDYIVVPNI